MKELALYVDYLLIGLVAVTAGLILYKIFELWAPKLVFRPTLAERVGSDRKQLDRAMEALEAGLPLLAVIASTAPFVGLVGTVMHIIEALRAMSGAGVDMAIISGPIATALNSTLVGLASAIPASVAYTLMQRKLQLMHNDKLREFE
jgi:biopolymer transport protein ExbB/TolQ